MSNAKPISRIENWMRLNDCLYGNVYNHERIADGSYVRTSIIVLPPGTVPLEEGMTVETRNTQYQLGKALGRFDA